MGTIPALISLRFTRRHRWCALCRSRRNPSPKAPRNASYALSRLFSFSSVRTDYQMLTF